MEPSVYALHFPLLELFKVGFTSCHRTAHSRAGRQSAKRMFGPDGDIAETLWMRPGDIRFESYIQAVLAFRHPQPRDLSNGVTRGQGRMCEWFNVDGLSLESIVEECESIYQEAIERSHQ